jgi:hypothetical protein
MLASLELLVAILWEERWSDSWCKFPIFRKDWEREIWGDLKQKDVNIASLNHLGPLGSPGERIYLQKLFAMTHANVFVDFLDELKLISYPHLAMQNKQKL